MTNIEPKYSTSEICKLTNIHRNTLYKWIEKKYIPEPAQKTIYRYRFSENDLNNIKEYCNRRINS